MNHSAFADDIDLLENTRDSLQTIASRLNTVAKAASLKINKEKTKMPVFGAQQISAEVEIDNRRLENVSEFVYLGSLITWDNDCSAEIKRRIAKLL